MIKKYSQLYLAGATKQQIDTAAKRLNLTPEELLKLVNEADPTNEKKFEAWLIKQLVFKNIRLPEDAPRVLQVLQNFIIYSNQNKVKYKDIARYKTIHDLETDLDSLRMVSFDPREKMTIETLKSFPGVQVFKGYNYVIAAISNQKSLETLGLGTKWCTRGDYPNGSMAEQYLEESLTKHLYIMYVELEDDSLERYCQFEDTFDQVMDVNDRRIPIRNDMYEDIKEMFYDLNLPNEQNALFYLYKEVGEIDELEYLLRDGNVSREVIISYFDTFNFYGKEPGRDDFILAINNKISHSAFEYVNFDMNPDVTLYFEYAVMTDTEHEIEEIVLETPEFFEDNDWEDISLSAVFKYYEKIVRPKLNTPKYTDVEEEDFDEEEGFKAISRKEKWINFFKTLLTTDDSRVYLGHDPEIILKVLQITGLNPLKFKNVLKDYPDVYEKYKEWQLSEGVIPDLLEHDYAVSDKIYLEGK